MKPNQTTAQKRWRFAYSDVVYASSAKVAKEMAIDAILSDLSLLDECSTVFEEPMEPKDEA